MVEGQRKNHYFYCVFEPCIKKASVFLPFEQHWSGANPRLTPWHPAAILGNQALGTLGWLSRSSRRCSRCPPTKVAETITFTMSLEPCIKKALVFIAFEQHWSGANAKTISFTLFLEPCIKKALVFIAFEQHWSGANGGLG